MEDTGTPPRAGREAVLVVLRRADGPVSATDVAEALGLHPNTVRGHLELLVRLGYATRAAEDRAERGRPRVLYAPVEAGGRPVEAYRSLATALVAELSSQGSGDSTAAHTGGEIWARSLVSSGRLRPVDDPEAAVAQVAGLADELGFDVATEPLGDRIYLRCCPYADLVDELPQTCTLHLGLLQAAFTQVGGGVTIEEIAMNIRPGVCLVRLHRPDLGPGTSIGPAVGRRARKDHR